MNYIFYIQLTNKSNITISYQTINFQTANSKQASRKNDETLGLVSVFFPLKSLSNAFFLPRRPNLGPRFLVYEAQGEILLFKKGNLSFLIG